MAHPIPMHEDHQGTCLPCSVPRLFVVMCKAKTLNGLLIPRGDEEEVHPRPSHASRAHSSRGWCRGRRGSSLEAQLKHGASL
ncbi:hypothetical protein E2C01_076924 [Portunus trituberculatus]|uniref:Uncharacterized protein n=1 Tax=Portunus trituberculatus TaxID=210409 RepID=A0A5B7IJU7_PORTR|nr:hypothetical protein [Portunus trituberculatus]